MSSSPNSQIAPAAPPVDFNSFTEEQLDSIIAAGGKLPESQDNPPAPEATPGAANNAAPDKAADGAKPDDKVAEPPKDEKAVEEPPKDEKSAEAAPDPEEAIKAFKFTENADEATRIAEEKAYLDLFDEIPEGVRQMIEIRDKRIAELAEAAKPPETDAETVKHMKAFDRLVERRQAEDGTWVHDTEGLRELLQTSYPTEYKQLIADINSAPSNKYPNSTLLEEFIQDGFGLDDTAMETLGMFFENGGKLPTPAYVPPGIDPKSQDAYWNSFSKKVIDDRLERITYALNDASATDQERADARAELANINAQLAREQRAIDRDREDRQRESQTKYRVLQDIENEGVDNYVKTTIGILDQAQKDLADDLTMFDAAGASITAAAYAQLVSNALSDAGEFSKAAQKELVAQGIVVDWGAAGAAVNELLDIEKKLAALRRDKANPRAIENVLNRKRTVLQDFKGFEKSLTGQIVAKLTAGAGSALKAKIEDATANGGKAKGFRPKVAGSNVPQGADVDFDSMSLEEINAYLEGKKFLATAAKNS